MISLSGIPVTEVDGSSIIHTLADSLGIDNCFTILEGAGHVAHVADADAYYQTLGTVSGALSSWLCSDYEYICGAYDYGVVGIEEWLVESEGAWRAFPSVVTGGAPLQVQWLQSPQASWTYQIFDASGRQVSEGMGNGDWFAIPTEGLPSGLHFLRMPGVADAQKFWVE